MKRTLFLSVFIVLMLPLISCGTVPQKEMTNNLTSTPVISTSTALMTESPIPTSLPTITLAPFLTPTPFPVSLMGDVRIVYSLEGKLFIQENQNQPVQLISNGKDVSSPQFINDGREIIFYKDGGDLFSLNVDGSGEQKMISQEWLNALGTGTSMGITAISGSRRLLIETILYPEKNNRESSIQGIFTVDIDTGDINELMKPRLVNQLLVEISPNGKFLAIASAGRIDVYDLNGNIVNSNVMNYTASTPGELAPMINWLPDSSGIVAALPRNKNVGWAYAYYFVYDVWSYKLGEKATYIPLDGIQPVWTVAGCGDNISISPDGSLLIYSHEDEIYLGHLQDGHTQALGISGCWDGASTWSLDSKYFTYRNTAGGPDGLLVSVYGASPVTAYWVGWEIQWMDENHYIVFVPASISGEEADKIFVVEFVDRIVNTYETDIFIPEKNDGFDFVLLQ